MATVTTNRAYTLNRVGKHLSTVVHCCQSVHLHTKTKQGLAFVTKNEWKSRGLIITLFYLLCVEMLKRFLSGTSLMRRDPSGVASDPGCETDLVLFQKNKFFFTPMGIHE